jgi:hypothetical protein
VFLARFGILVVKGFSPRRNEELKFAEFFTARNAKVAKIQTFLVVFLGVLCSFAVIF